MGGGATVVLKSVQKKFGDFVALDNIDLTIESGEFLTLLGPSGSGKTTTLMIIAGFEKASGGEVLVDSRNISDIPVYKRGLGMVFQHYSLFPHMNVYDNVAFPLRMRKFNKSAISEQVKSALELVELEDFGTRYPGQLSGGQQQRVALARALVFKPGVLLMDEPLGALDKNLRENMQLEIKRIQKKLGITVIFVTHDQEEALVMSDKIAVMSKGRIEQIGSPKDIYEYPVNKYVADFLGTSNFIDAVITDIQSEEYVLKTCFDNKLAVKMMGFKQTHQVGDAVVLSIRPEKISLHDREGFIQGSIAENIFTGNSIKYFVELENGQNVCVIGANNSNTQEYGVGQKVWLSWQQDDARILAS